METLERQCDSIDRLTSLVSKMNVKIDKKETHTSLEFIKTDIEAKEGVDNPTFTLETYPLVETRIEMEGTIITMTRIIDQPIQIGLEIIIERMTEDLHISFMTGVVITDLIIGIEVTTDKTIDKIIEVMTLERDMEIGVKVEIGLETIVMAETEVETEVEIEMDRCRTGPESCLMTEEN